MPPTKAYRVGMTFRVAGAQMNLTVGDISGNEAAIADAMTMAAEADADMLLVPELALTGYPPEDLVHRRDFVDANLAALHRLALSAADLTAIVGFVDHASDTPRGAADSEETPVANAAAILGDGCVSGIYHKVLLPNYGVFDEDRYFSVGVDPGQIWRVGEVSIGVSICEDIWLPGGPPSQQAERGAQLLLNINASPFHLGKAAEREEMLATRARAARVPVIYLNLVGGQDELVFDGASVVFDGQGNVIHSSPQFEEDFFVVDIPIEGETASSGLVCPLAASTRPSPPTSPQMPSDQTGYRALRCRLGTRRSIHWRMPAPSLRTLVSASMSCR